MRQPGNISVGLFGGSFNPAHAGHQHVAEAGLKALGLDQIWWLVSPQNPLKPKQPSWDSRAATVEKLGLSRQHIISDVEQRAGTQYTIDLLRQLRARHPDTRFVFLMGADNLSQLPRWKDWQAIMENAPIAVIARPGAPMKARLGQVARQYADHRVPEYEAQALPYLPAPAWTYLTLPYNSLSSTALRRLKS